MILMVANFKNNYGDKQITDVQTIYKLYNWTWELVNWSSSKGELFVFIYKPETRMHEIKWRTRQPLGTLVARTPSTSSTEGKFFICGMEQHFFSA